MILTSLLALTACGGGSGGGVVGGATYVPSRNTVVTQSNTVDADSGLSMIDINKARNAKYEAALSTVQSIENEYNVNDDLSIERKAVTTRNGGMHGKTTFNYSAEEVNAAYASMKSILVDRNMDGKKAHDMLIALALAGLDKNDILNLFNNELNNLDNKIQAFVDILLSNNRPDAVQNVINNAESVYKDFGSEFTLTLENVRFDSTAGLRDFTFTVDENVKITKLVGTEHGIEREYGVLNGGKFQTRVKGVEYYVGGTFGGHDFSSERFYADGQTPSDAQIRADLLAAATSENPGASVELAELQTWLSTNPPIIRAGESCNNNTGCIIYAPLDYTDQITVESKGQKLGLKYSDFGLRLDAAIMHPGHVDYDPQTGEAYTMPKDLTYVEHAVFAGGYHDKIANTPNSAATFNGVAYAGVTQKRNDWNPDLSNYVPPKTNYYTGTAKLTVTPDNENLNQKLVADFIDAGWYKVTVNDVSNTAPSGARGGNGNIQFDGNITSNFYVNYDNHGDLVGELNDVSVAYYGPDVNTPTEAVGFVQYVERDANAESDDYWNF